jgi:hypothetical protein
MSGLQLSTVLREACERVVANDGRMLIMFASLGSELCMTMLCSMWCCFRCTKIFKLAHVGRVLVCVRGDAVMVMFVLRFRDLFATVFSVDLPKVHTVGVRCNMYSM